MFFSRWTMIFLVLACTLPLLACGRKGPPGPPPGEKSTYPQTYPSPNE